jgi:dolichol-phosphate mannosyltransferase
MPPTESRNGSVVFVGLPAHNEEIAIQRLFPIFESLIARGQRLHIIVYNDGSTDRTGKIAREWAAKIPLILLETARNQGLGAGLRGLVKYVVDRGFKDDVLVIMDCDDTHDPHQIETMVEHINQGCDIVIASRFRSGALTRGVPVIRRLTALGAMALCKSLNSVPGVLDYTSGYRAYRLSLLRAASARYGDGLITEPGFACMVELLLKLSTLKPRVAEIPLLLRYDLKATDSKMDITSNITRLLKLIIRWKFSESRR